MPFEKPIPLTSEGRGERTLLFTALLLSLSLLCGVLGSRLAPPDEGALASVVESEAAEVFLALGEV